MLSDIVLVITGFVFWGLFQDIDTNEVPVLTLPSISEDDENAQEEGQASPTSPPPRSPMHGNGSPRQGRFNSRLV